MSRRLWSLALALALLLLAGCAPAAVEPDPPPSVDPVPANPYDADGFAVTDGFLTYAGDAPSIVGIDVSSYQREIDWPAVAEAGVQFAIVRVGFRGYTEGGLFEDSRFRENLEGALDAGLEVGVYFFSQAVTEREAEQEAAYLLERIRDYDVRYPVVFDWERQTNQDSRTANTSGAAVTACARAFCRAVEAEGYRAMVYFSPNKAKELDLEQLLDWPFWLAHYTADWEPTGFRYHFAMWQYSCEGQVDGIEAPVDLNLCLTDFLHEKNRGPLEDRLEHRPSAPGSVPLDGP